MGEILLNLFTSLFLLTLIFLMMRRCLVMNILLKLVNAMGPMHGTFFVKVSSKGIKLVWSKLRGKCLHLLWTDAILLR